MRRFSLLTLLAVTLTLGLFCWLNLTPTIVAVDADASETDEVTISDYAAFVRHTTEGEGMKVYPQVVDVKRYGMPFRVASKRRYPIQVSIPKFMDTAFDQNRLLTVNPNPIGLVDTLSDHMPVDESWNRKHFAYNIAIALAALLAVGMLTERFARRKRPQPAPATRAT